MDKDKKEFTITTIDNPYDPFTNYDEWYMYDCQLGYNTSAYIARLTNTTPKMTEKEKTEEIERVMDLIIAYDPFDIYKRVYKK